MEIDALGAERIAQAMSEGARRARRLREWTEEEMGETLTDENKAELAKRLRDAASEIAP